MGRGSPVALRPHKHGHVKAAGLEGKVLEKGPPGCLKVTQKTLFISTLGSEKVLGKLNVMISVCDLPTFVYALLSLCASVSFPSVLPFSVFFWYTFTNVKLLRTYNLGPEELVHFHQFQLPQCPLRERVFSCSHTPSAFPGPSLLVSESLCTSPECNGCS